MALDVAAPPATSRLDAEAMVECAVKNTAHAFSRDARPEHKRRRGSSSEHKCVHFSVLLHTVIGHADADVDRTPRGEPARCSCCGLHVVGYAFGCAPCAGVMERFELCAMCFGAHAHLSQRTTQTSDETVAKVIASSSLMGFRVHDHPPQCFIRTGDDDQMALDEILSDRRNLMVNGRGSAEEDVEATSPAKTLSRASSGRSSDEAFDATTTV